MQFPRLVNVFHMRVSQDCMILLLVANVDDAVAVTQAEIVYACETIRDV